MNKKILPGDLVSVIIVFGFYTVFSVFIVKASIADKSIEIYIGASFFIIFSYTFLYNVGWRYLKIEYENTVLVNGFRKERIKIEDIEYLYMWYYKIKFSSNTIPAVLVFYKDMKKPFPIFHRKYRKDDLVEFINCLKVRNPELTYCDSISAMIDNRDYQLENEYRKNDKNLWITIGVATVITIVLVYFEII